MDGDRAARLVGVVIPGYPYATYREISAKEFRVLMCGAPLGCPKDFSRFAHTIGKVDRAGTIHWDNADKRATRRGMRTLMNLMALNFNRSYWAEPKWKQLYLVNTWAWKEARKRFHIVIKTEWTLKDRIASQAHAKRVKAKIRWSYPNIYRWWQYAGLTAKVQWPSPSQGSVQPQD